MLIAFEVLYPLALVYGAVSIAVSGAALVVIIIGSMMSDEGPSLVEVAGSFAKNPPAIADAAAIMILFGALWPLMLYKIFRPNSMRPP